MLLGMQIFWLIGTVTSDGRSAVCQLEKTNRFSGAHLKGLLSKGRAAVHAPDVRLDRRAVQPVLPGCRA